MPLRALIEGKEIVSILLNDAEWVALKRDLKSNKCSVVLPCCQSDGFLRTSSRGLRHFVHSKKGASCDWESETPQHLKSKAEIVRACRDTGWLAVPEYSESDWRADVLATKGAARIAFEVQWSAQTEEETSFRQKRYQESKVRGCWFFKNPPKQFRDWPTAAPLAMEELPIFKIAENEQKEISVLIGPESKDLYHHVCDLLRGHIRYSPVYSAVPEQMVEISFFKLKCWKCGADQHLYFTDIVAHSYCGKKMGAGDIDLDLHPLVIKHVREILRSGEGSGLRLGQIKERYSKTEGRSYLSFGCHCCDVLFGNFFLNHGEKLMARYLEDNIVFRRPISLKISEDGPHWCYSESGSFCSK